jgi:hypothetical protein
MEQATQPKLRAVWIGRTMHWPQTDEEFKERMAELKADVARRTPPKLPHLQLASVELATTAPTLVGNEEQ